MVLTKDQEEKLLAQVDDLLQQRDCPRNIRDTALEVRAKLTSQAATPEERHEVAKRLAKQIDAFVLAFAKARPEREPAAPRSALPTPDDTPFAPAPRRKAPK